MYTGSIAHKLGIMYSIEKKTHHIKSIFRHIFPLHIQGIGNEHADFQGYIQVSYFWNRACVIEKRRRRHMQIIPVNTRESNIQSTLLGISTYSSYSNTVGVGSALLEKNSHLLLKSKERLSPRTQLSFEEVLRLKNTIQEKRKPTHEEKEALAAVLEQGGSCTVQELIEQMADGIGGIQGLNPEEYVSLQQFLQDIGYGAEDIERLTNQMMTKEGALQAIDEIVMQGKAYAGQCGAEAELYNVLPILRKVALGQYGNTTGHIVISPSELLSGLESILYDIEHMAADTAQRVENLSVAIADELEDILMQRGQREQNIAHASTMTQSSVTAEELRYTQSATKDAISAYIRSSNEEQSFSEYSGNEQGDKEHILEYEMLANKNNMFSLAGHTITTYGGSPNMASMASLKSSILSEHMLEGHAKYIMETVEQGFISLQNNKAAQITLQLNPQQLGHIQLQLQYHDGRMHAILRPEQHEIYQLLKEQSPHIMQALQEHGLNVDAVAVIEGKGEWLQYQSSREGFSHNADSNAEGKEELQIQERKGRIRNILERLVQGETPAIRRSTRLLEVVA